MNTKLIIKLLLSHDINDQAIAASLAVTEADIFELLWISNGVIHIQEWDETPGNYFEDFLKKIEENYEYIKELDDELMPFFNNEFEGETIYYNDVINEVNDE